MKSLLRFVLNISALGVGIAAVGCSYDHTSTLPSTQSASKPATTTPSTGSSGSSFIGTWSDAQTSGAPTVTGCGNFTWAISSQTAQNVAGTFSFSCAGNVTVNATATGILTSATTADLTVTGSGNVNGTNCDLSVTGTATFTSDTLTFPYTGTTCYGPIRGTESMQKKSSTPPPPPPPDPTPTPDPTPPPPPPPAFDLGNSIILNSPYDLASWPITSTLTDVNLGPNGIHVEFSKRDGPGRWPDVFPPGWDEPLQYTLGMCLNVSGQWYCSAVTQFWYGLDRAGGPPSQYANNWFYDPNRWAPMTGHQPAVGETIGIFVCAGNCRNNTRGDNSTVKERTNVALVAMPSDAGADYTFSAARTIRRK
jgi:hypothetical protein